MELAGRHVVVTGAASGIGRACATRFAADGARVVVADLDGEGAEVVAHEIDGRAMRVDVSRETEIRTLVAGAEEAGGPIDLFFSNAGVGGPPGGPEVDDDALQMTWQVNVLAHVWAARALLPAMVQRGDGYLLSTASAAGLLTQLSALAYSATKHAAVAVAEWLSITYADAGVKVSCLCPQGVRTPMLELALEDPVALFDPPARRRRQAHRLQGRSAGTVARGDARSAAPGPRPVAVDLNGFALSGGSGFLRGGAAQLSAEPWPGLVEPALGLAGPVGVVAARA